MPFWEKMPLFCIGNGAEFRTSTTGWKSPVARKKGILKIVEKLQKIVKEVESDVYFGG
jgi:hypothetical protein